MAENIADSKLFEKLGFNENNKWILEMEGNNAFFQWFAENISDENILSDLEIAEYEELKRNGELLEGNDLKAAMEDLENSYPGITEITEFDKDLLKSKLETITEIEESHEAFQKSMKETQSKQIREISDIEKLLIDSELNLKRVTNDCVEKTKLLTKKQQENQQKIATLNQCYLQAYTPPLFMHQMPLDQYYIKCDQFLKYLEVYMKKNFKIEDCSTNADQNYLYEFWSDIETAKNRLVFTENKLKEENINIECKKLLIEKVDNHQWRPMSYHDLRRVNSEIENENDNKKLQLEVLKQELSLLVNENVDQQIQNLFHEFNIDKKKRATDRMDKVMTISNMLATLSFNVEILWIMMQLDIKKLKNKVDDSEELFNEAQLCSKRIRQMKNLEKPDNTMEIILQHKLFLLLENYMETPPDELDTIKSLLQDFISVDQNIEKYLATIVGRKFYSDFDAFMEFVREQEKILKPYVYDGPTDKPQLFDPRFLEVIQDKILKNNKISEELDNFKKEYTVNHLKKMNNNKFYRYKMDLWIYFLTTPKKVLQVIKDVTEAASKTHMMKAVSGFKQNAVM